MVVRLLEGPLAAGDVQGQVERVSDGAVLAVRGVDELVEVVIGAGRAVDIPDEVLTDRQREVLALLRSGRSNAEIGDVLGISEHTVRKHLERVFRALGVRTRAEAIVGRTPGPTGTRNCVSTVGDGVGSMDGSGGEA